MHVCVQLSEISAYHNVIIHNIMVAIQLHLFVASKHRLLFLMKTSLTFKKNFHYQLDNGSGILF